MEKVQAKKRTWRVIDLIKWGEDYFNKHNFEGARQEIEWLLCDLLDCKRIDLYVKFEEIVPQSKLSTLNRWIKKRLNRMPLQYITGKTEFYGNRIFVNQEVLIPRPETERLVDIALEEMETMVNPKILEIGTGSGCISISIAAHRIDANIVATDISQSALEKAMENADGIVCTVTDSITDELLTLPNKKVKIVANIGVGVDHIDLQSAKQNNVIITNTPDVLTEATVDIATLLLLSVTRNAFLMETMLRQGEWKGFSLTENLGVGVRGKTLGLVGMGRIGSAVARRAKSFGLNINYHNRNRVAESIEKELNATYWASLDQMLSSMDIISLNCPHTPATYHLLSPRRLKLIKRDAYIVNTSRGEVLHQDTLIELLQEKKIMGAGLDVFEKEPLIDERLLNLKNVFLLPHMSSATLEGRVEMGERVIINIRTMVDGHRPPDRVISGTTI